MTTATTTKANTEPTILGTIHVSQEDIDGSTRGVPNLCAVALATRRTYPNAFSVYVMPNSDPQSGIWWTIRIDSMKANIGFTIPSEIVAKIQQYDRTGVMTPFSFDIVI
jgi:hypothetical protein